MRWLVPVFLVVLLSVSVLLAPQGRLYVLALVGQLVFYGVAAAAHLVPAWRERSLPRLIYYFVQVNVSIVDAVCRFLAGKRMPTWQPSAR